MVAPYHQKHCYITDSSKLPSIEYYAKTPSNKSFCELYYKFYISDLQGRALPGTERGGLGLLVLRLAF